MKRRSYVLEKVQALLAAGTIRVEGSDYVGTASDGTIVLLGTVGFEERLLDYLTFYPTPDKW